MELLHRNFLDICSLEKSMGILSIPSVFLNPLFLTWSVGPVPVTNVFCRFESRLDRVLVETNFRKKDKILL